MLGRGKRLPVVLTLEPPPPRANRGWIGRIGLVLLLLSSVLTGWAPGDASLSVAASASDAVPARQAGPNPIVGLQVGEQASDFTVTTLEGELLSSADLLAQGKPFILYFFATWCTTCRAEFRLLKNVYPPYADRVNFVAVGIDPTEGPDVLRAYQQSNGYPWTVTLGAREVLERYNVISTAIKYAVDRQGTITFEWGYGVEDAGSWERVFEGLLRR